MPNHELGAAFLGDSTQLSRLCRDQCDGLLNENVIATLQEVLGDCVMSARWRRNNEAIEAVLMCSLDGVKNRGLRIA